jgi:hypothetical protein
MAADRGAFEIYAGRRRLGSFVKSRPGTVFAYGPDGVAVGTFADIDAAVAALTNPLALDTDIGNRLGMARPTNIRELIKQHRSELEQFGNLHVVGAKSDARRGPGRPANAEYLLNEEQALLIATVSEAPNAPAVRAMLIRTLGKSSSISSVQALS